MYYPSSPRRSLLVLAISQALFHSNMVQASDDRVVAVDGQSVSVSDGEAETTGPVLAAMYASDGVKLIHRT